MKNNLITGILTILVFVFGWLAFLPSAPATSASKYHYALGLSTINDITCTYAQTLYSSYQGEEITHELPPPETNPIIMTFSGFDAKVAKIKFIDSTQTISEVPIVKMVDTQEKLMFIEGNGEPYMTVHTIYKESGVATFAKSVSLLGIPVGTTAMGTCVDS